MGRWESNPRPKFGKLLYRISPMAPSPVILSSPIILFLGAGASAALQKRMMEEFVNKTNLDISDQQQNSMLKLLTEFCGPDLEAIMGELDTLTGMKYALSVSGYRDLKFSRRDAGGPTVEAFSLQKEVAADLQGSIRHAIIREYRDVDAGQTVKLYKSLFDCLFSNLDASNQCLVIFTTNYDPAIEIFCREKFHEYSLCDGFPYDVASREHYWDRADFDNFKLDRRKRNIVLFKIHGSVDWLRVVSTDKIKRGQPMYTAIDSQAYKNVLIYPATRKIAMDDPYYSGYEYYQRCCEKAKLCLAIGYSFRDYDALTRLRGASSVNEKLRLALIAPNAEEVLTSASKIGWMVVDLWNWAHKTTVSVRAACHWSPHCSSCLRARPMCLPRSL